MIGKRFLLLLPLLWSCNCWHVRRLLIDRVIRNVVAGSVALAVSFPSFASDLTEQLKAIQQLQFEAEKTRIQTEEADLLSRELAYPEGKLIARGVVRVLGDGSGADVKKYPLGLNEAYFLNPAFSSDKASLYLLAVGKEGPPLAAKKYPVNQLKFPLTFEITDADLLFPYTTAAWLASPNHEDTIAVTAILSADDKLSTPNDADRIGMGLSTPTVIAGAKVRSTAAVDISAAIDINLYKEEEVSLLANIDSNIDRNFQANSK